MKNLLRGIIVLLCLVCFSTFVAAQIGGGITVPSADAGWASSADGTKSNIGGSDTDNCANSVVPIWYVKSTLGSCTSWGANGGDSGDKDGDGCTNLQEYCRFLLASGAETVESMSQECNDSVNETGAGYLDCGCGNGYCESAGNLDETQEGPYVCYEDCSAYKGGDTAQCSDGFDNDGDFYFDYGGPDCVGNYTYASIYGCDPECQSESDPEEIEVPEFSVFGIIVIILAAVAVYAYVKRS